MGLFVLLPAAAAAVVVLLVERWSRLEPWCDWRLAIGLTAAALAGTFALVVAAVVAGGALALRTARLNRVVARLATLAVPAALVVVAAVSAWVLLTESIRIVD